MVVQCKKKSFTRDLI